MTVIRRLPADPGVHVAVVGEFNSGKTTVVNTLLQEPVLSVAPVVSTGCAVFVQYGPRRRVSFRPCSDGPLVTWPGEDFWTALREVGPHVRPRSQFEAVDSLVTDPGVSSRIDAVVVHHPAEFLRQGVVLVDTPGINADDERHESIARATATDVADLVVVVVPANSPVSRVVAEFLTGVLADHRGRRCVVVTKLDHIELHQQDLVLQTIRRRLDTAGLDDAPIALAHAIGGDHCPLVELVRRRRAAQCPPDESLERLLVAGRRRCEDAVARRAVGWALSLERDLDRCAATHQVCGVIDELGEIARLAEAWMAAELNRFDAELRLAGRARAASGPEPVTPAGRAHRASATAVAAVLDRYADRSSAPSRVRRALAAAPWAVVSDMRSALLAATDAVVGTPGADVPVHDPSAVGTAVLSRPPTLRRPIGLTH